MKFTKKNRLMDKYLKKIKFKKDYSIDLKELNMISETNLINFEGCIILDYNSKIMPKIWKEKGRTEFEISKNHIHMSDFIKNEKNLALLSFGFVVCKIIFIKLKSQFPRSRFRIVISYDVNNEFGYNDCIVTFYKVRKNDINYYNKLEEFKNEAIGYYDI